MISTGTQRTGFTLVELLIVVGVIAILISLLLPSLAKARASAQILACTNNLRQIGTAFMTYAADNKNQWPVYPGTTVANAWTQRTFEGFQLEEMLSRYTGVKAGIEEGSAWIPSVGGAIWICPASDVQAGASVIWGNPMKKGYHGSTMPPYDSMQNCYTGLAYHWQTAVATDRSDVNWRPCWRQNYWKRGYGVPVQWCSMRKANAAMETLGAPSWHGTGVTLKRPVAFADGHVAVVTNSIYTSGQDIMSANANDGVKSVHASVECPLGDFFCNGWKTRANVLALPINVNPSGGFNCYFPMPFRKHVRMTIENRAPDGVRGFFYTINYALTEVADDDAYFHAQFRRTNPLPYKDDYVILDGVRGKGHYVGTYMCWQQNSAGWWGEGEIKIFLDGDREFPTICGTGTEDYFGGAWCFGANYSAAFLGFPLGNNDGKVGNRHGLYRFHIMDPIRFSQDLRVTMQAIGWRSESRYLPLQDDIASVAYWYQTEPHATFPKLGDRDALEVI